MSLSKAAYEKFKQYLYNERISPGQFFSQTELCDLLDVSKAPLRDALKELEFERIVELLPRRGIRVASIDRQFIKNAFQIRRYFEVGACRELANTGGLQGLGVLKEQTLLIIERFKGGIDDALLDDAFAVDWALHKALIASLENSLLSDVHRRNNDRVMLIRLNVRFIAERIVSAMQEHLNIIEAIEAGDAEKAGAAMEHHLSVSESRALGEKRAYK
ncbi:MAG: GntR family transcriptional regulator [Oceanospirillaceae bacterium]|nr:GntR family transcriptional regulator [Oceanospirillaceae bacterium]